MTQDDISTGERRVLAALAAAWNIYLTLPVEHPADQRGFCRLIHDAQARVLLRPARRQLAAEDAVRRA